MIRLSHRAFGVVLLTIFAFQAYAQAQGQSQSKSAKPEPRPTQSDYLRGVWEGFAWFGKMGDDKVFHKEGQPSPLTLQFKADGTFVIEYPFDTEAGKWKFLIDRMYVAESIYNSHANGTFWLKGSTLFGYVITLVGKTDLSPELVDPDLSDSEKKKETCYELRLAPKPRLESPKP